jgi:MobA/MobL family protein
VQRGQCGYGLGHRVRDLIQAGGRWLGWGRRQGDLRTYANSEIMSGSRHLGPQTSPMTRSLRRHLSISLRTVCRHRNDSFPRKAAYILRSRAYNSRTGIWHDFTEKGGVEDSGIVGWNGTLEELLVAAVMSEQRDRAVEGREIINAIPFELTRRQRLALAKKCARYIARKFAAAVVYAVHRPPDDPRNWHVHFLMTSRRVISGRALGLKTRELDDRKTGGPHIEAFRAWWCAAMNLALRQAGHEGNVEHRSYFRVGEEAEPGSHKGVRRTAIERRHRPRPLPIPQVPSPEIAPPAQEKPLPAGRSLKNARADAQGADVGHTSSPPIGETGQSKRAIQHELDLVGSTVPPALLESEETQPERQIRPPLPTPSIPGLAPGRER